MKNMDQLKHKKLKFSEPAVYQIMVQGNLSPDWPDRLRGMDVEVKYGKDRHPVSILTGKISDQAALAGILKSLYEAHLPVINVINLGDLEMLISTPKNKKK